MDSKHYDVVVIGAGLSGLSAATRLGMFGKKVLLLEKHYVVGGLNSFCQKSKKFDVGLHALTNYPSSIQVKISLLKLCRQLRIPFDSWICMTELFQNFLSWQRSCFTNHFPDFLEQIHQHFKSIDPFAKLMEKMEGFPAYSVGPRTFDPGNPGPFWNRTHALRNATVPHLLLRFCPDEWHRLPYFCDALWCYL